MKAIKQILQKDKEKYRVPKRVPDPARPQCSSTALLTSSASDGVMSPELSLMASRRRMPCFWSSFLLS